MIENVVFGYQKQFGKNQCVYDHRLSSVNMWNGMIKDKKWQNQERKRTWDTNNGELSCLENFNPVCTNGIFLPIWYNNLWTVHCIYQGVMG